MEFARGLGNMMRLSEPAPIDDADRHRVAALPGVRRLCGPLLYYCEQMGWPRRRSCEQAGSSYDRSSSLVAVAYFVVKATGRIDGHFEY